MAAPTVWMDPRQRPSDPATVPFDPTLQAHPGAGSADNRGCPPGYFAQYVDGAAADAMPWRHGFVRCRLLPQPTSPTYQEEIQQVTDENAPPFWAETALNVEAARQAIVPYVQLGGVALLLLLGLYVVLLMKR